MSFQEEDKFLSDIMKLLNDYKQNEINIQQTNDTKDKSLLLQNKFMTVINIEMCVNAKRSELLECLNTEFKNTPQSYKSMSTDINTDDNNTSDDNSTNDEEDNNELETNDEVDTAETEDTSESDENENEDNKDKNHNRYEDELNQQT